MVLHIIMVDFLLALGFKMDFSVRCTMLNVFLQSFIIAAQNFGVCQVQVQRQLSLKCPKLCIKASIISGILTAAYHLLCTICGLIFYAHFKFCDPTISPDKPISSPDQLLPYYITSTMGNLTGVTGLCIAGIFSASLSSLSSSINSMAAVTCEDIIRPLWPSLTNLVLITKIASVFFGALSILSTFIVASLGNLLPIALTVNGMVSGPILGVYILAVLTTTANKVGTNLGVTAGFLLAIWLSFFTPKSNHPMLPVGRNCSEPFEAKLNSTIPFYAEYIADNSSEWITTEAPEKTLPLYIFPISFMWISSFALVTCVAVGYIGSWAISYIRGNREDVPQNLLSPIRQRFYHQKEQVNFMASHKLHDAKDVGTSGC